MKLICPHQSSNLPTQTISKPNKRTSGFDALTDAVNQLNTNKGTSDPTVVIKTPFENVPKNGIRLDPALSNDYIFEAINYKQAVDIILEKESNPPEGGGSFEWHYARFQSLYAHPNNTDLDKVAVQVFEQGFKDNSGSFTNVPSVTIEKKPITVAKSTLLETDSALESETGTNLVAIGHRSAGSYTVEYMKFQGAKDTFRLAKLWKTATDYTEGILVREGGVTYECIADHTSSGVNQPPNASFWIVRTFVKPALWLVATTYAKNDLVFLVDEAYKSLSSSNTGNSPDTSLTFWIRVGFVPAVDYSPLTKDKAQYWVNAMAGWNQADQDNLKTAAFDPNIIIRDDKHNRTLVDGVFNDPSLIPAIMLDAGSAFDTLRVLVIGSGAGVFASADPNGKSFTDAIAEFRTDVGIGGPAWFVYRSAVTDDEIVDMREGDCYTYKPCEGVGSYVDGAGACIIGARSSGWVNGVYLLIDIPAVGKFGTFSANDFFECLHPVKHDGSNDVEVGNESITNEFGNATSAVFANFNVQGNQRTFYAGLNFAFPWPRNSNAKPHGSVTLGEKIKLAVFDLLNMHLTHEAKREWFGPQVEDYFPIQGFQYFERIEDFLLGGIRNPTGDYAMGYFLIDRNDNVIVTEYTHGHNFTTTPQGKAITNKPYRGLVGIASFIPAGQVEANEIFDVRNVVRGGIFTRDSFDSNGRYISPKTLITSLLFSRTRFFTSEKIHIAVDAFRWSKPLVATNVRSTLKPIRNIEPRRIRADKIISYGQLRNFVENSEKIFSFEKEEWPIKTALRCDIAFGDPVYYKDPDAVDESDDALSNTRKVVADEIIYTISKPAEGPGGFVRQLNLNTRVWP